MRFTRLFSLLLESGIPLLEALELAKNSVGNLYLKNLLEEAAEKVSKGEALEDVFSFFPPFLLRLVITGEKTGKLGSVLERAAVTYEKEWEKRIQTFLNILEPLMILFLGLIVGFVVMAVLLPILNINQMVKL